MPKYQVAYNAASRVATIQPDNDAPPAGSIAVGSFDHNEEIDPLDAAVNHVLFHHVRDIMYKRSHANPANEAMFPNNITDMHNIVIAVDNVANPMPANTVAPAITGTAEVGSVLTTTNGTWTNAATYARQWARAATAEGPWTNIGAGATTYTLVAGDLNQLVRCVVTATGTNGNKTANSNIVGPVEAAG